MNLKIRLSTVGIWKVFCNRPPYLPQSAREMIITAENTGKLGEVTHLLGAYYEEEAEAKMRQLVGLMEPIITVGMGVLVATAVLAVMLPIFDLSTLASSRH